MPEDWNRDWGVWGSGSGREGEVGHTDHGRGGLPDGGEGKGTRYQPDFGRASRDRGVWGERIGATPSYFMKKNRAKESLIKALTRISFKEWGKMD